VQNNLWEDSLSNINIYFLRSSDNSRPIYGRNNLRKFSIKCAGSNNWNKIPPLKSVIRVTLAPSRLNQKTIFHPNRTDKHVLRPTTVVN